MEYRTIWKLKEGWRYTTAPQKELPYDAYALTKAGGQTGPAAITFDDHNWDTVCVPHDLTADAELAPENINFNGYIRQENIWYRRMFYLSREACGRRLILRFFGVTGESRVWVNGCLMTTNHTAFCGFDVDITDVVRFGPEPNLIAVHSDNSRMEGWWYQGCGIFREVWLVETAMSALDEDSLRVKTTQNGDAWTVDGAVSWIDRAYEGKDCTLRVQLLDGEICLDEAQVESCPADTEAPFQLEIQNPRLWAVGEGNLYTLRVTLVEDGRAVDSCEKRIGFRTLRFDKDEGFFLNGVHTVMKGMCYHEDEGNLGWNIGRETYERRVRNLLAMGGNAYRCSHNAPAQELLELCDEYGVLVMDECRRYDTGPVALHELEWMVRRDRCHPSIVLWSIGNEEPWQRDDRGRRILRTCRKLVHKLDGTRPVTSGMLNGFFETETGGEMDVLGVNYNHLSYDQIRAKYPDRAFVGTEILNLADVVYENGNPYNGTDGAFETLFAMAERPYFCGSFGWAGQEYRGDHRNLAFFTDCCPVSITGDVKDGFYRYRALWDTAPTIHLCGHWSHQPGKNREVSVYTNADETRLYLNGREVGVCKGHDRFEARFIVPYEPGTLRAVGFWKGEALAEDKLETADRPVRLVLKPEKTELAADGTATVSIDVTAQDAQGRIAPMGSFLFTAQVDGPAELLCCDNADPYCSAFPEKDTSCLYHGHGKIILRSLTQPGTVRVSVTCPELEGDGCEIALTEAESRFLPAADSPYINDWFVSHVWEQEPDIYEYTEDIHYIKWQKYLEPAFNEAEALPFYYRSGWVIYCMEPNVPELPEGGKVSLAFENIIGEAKILVSIRDYNNVVTRQFYTEKTVPQWGSVHLPLEGAVSGDRLIIKLVIHGSEPQAGLWPVRFEVE